MNEKTADNFIDKDRREIKRIDNEIYDEKGKKKSLDSIEESFVSLNNNINKCIDLLYASIKGGNVERKLDSIRDDSNKSYVKSVAEIDAERQKIDAKISKLYNERDTLSEKVKKDTEPKEQKGNETGNTNN